MFGRKKRSLSDFDEEIQARLDLETEEFKEDGLSEEFFATLGVQPLRGTDFRQSKEKHAVGGSNRFWRNELMRADDAIGKPMKVYDTAFTIIGIMPESLDFPTGADIWTHWRDEYMSSARQYLGRLRPGISLGKAAEELKALEFKPGIGLEGNPAYSRTPFLSSGYGRRAYIGTGNV